ncbi:MAG TPA: hypothetical protein VFF65_12725 [Phycisphaerales bacterium]|nr:hypothetical protein [Phycisphaerales bacterium]
MTNPYDPYDPGHAAPSPLYPASPSIALPPYTFEGAWSAGLAVFKTNYPMLLAAGAILVGVQVVASIIQAALEQVEPCLASFWSLGISLGVSIPLGVSNFLIGARAARGGKVELADLLLGYRRLGWLILWTLAFGVAAVIALIPGVLVVMAVASSAGQDAALIAGIALAVLVYLPLFIYFGTRLYFVLPILVDPAIPKLSLGDAVKASWSLTRTSWLSLFALGFVVGLLLVATILLLCVGVIFLGYPVYLSVIGAAYAMTVAPLVRQSAPFV